MGEKRTVNVKVRTGKSLNLVLWFSFALFALLLVLIYNLVQNFLVTRQYKEASASTLKEAGGEIEQVFGQTDDSTAIYKRVLSVSNRYGVGFFLVYEDGESVWPDYTEQLLPEIVQKLQEELQEKHSTLFYNNNRELSYGSSVMMGTRECYLCLTVPALIYSHTLNFRWMSFMTALFSIVLAFVASGIVSMIITKPVSEVTEQAKELARGNYNLNFKKEYFCSEMTELADALESARTEISKADKMQKELIANVSHDFKTPLTMIKAYASMIREISGDDKSKRDAHAQVIIDESDRLAALVGDLLDLSKLRAGLTDDARTVFNLSEEVYRIAGRFDYLAQTENYVIETAVEDELYTSANRERIEQVLYNLIGNAINYTGEDKRVRIKLFRKGDVARFEVIDSGKGIPPEELDTIWDRYYRSNKTHKRPAQGTGLGLSIVKSILLVQECPFGVVSEVGKGSCFWVEFVLPQDNLFEDSSPQPAQTESKPKEEKKKERRKRHE